MLLLIIFLLGGLGSGWPRDPEDYWPRWCIACRVIIGGLSAIIINVLAGAAMPDAGFTGLVVVPSRPVMSVSAYSAARLTGVRPQSGRTIRYRAVGRATPSRR